jgi:hypothetical protein
MSSLALYGIPERSGFRFAARKCDERENRGGFSDLAREKPPAGDQPDVS